MSETMHVNLEQGSKGQREVAEVGTAAGLQCGYIKIRNQL